MQGKSTHTFGYEYLRIIGFPAVVEHHLTLGIGYESTSNMSLNLAYMHAFENTVSENPAFDAISPESSLKESSYSFGVNRRF